jgi:hypothetical protein
VRAGRKKVFLRTGIYNILDVYTLALSSKASLQVLFSSKRPIGVKRKSNIRAVVIFLSLVVIPPEKAVH